MANVVTVKIEGLRQLDDALMNQLPKRVRSVVKGALTDAGDWMRDKIFPRVPVYDKNDPRHPRGHLRSSLMSTVTLSAKLDRGTVETGFSKSGWYGIFPEFGSVHNVPAKPSIRPAFEENAEGWLSFLTARLRERLGL